MLFIAASIFFKPVHDFDTVWFELSESFPSDAAYLRLDAGDFIGLRVKPWRVSIYGADSLSGVYHKLSAQAYLWS